VISPIESPIVYTSLIDQDILKKAAVKYFQGRNKSYGYCKVNESTAEMRKDILLS
jgi:hypothetical protein